MAQDPTFDDLLARLRAGDEDAATAIFNRYVHLLVGLARTRLDPVTRQKVDPEEVANSALGSFFRGYAEGRFELDGWDSLWEVLLVITLRKCGRRVEYFRAKRRNVAQEVRPGGADDDALAWAAIAHEPTPEEAAMLSETVEQVMRGLQEHERPVLTLALQGYSLPQISEQVGRTERTVYRALRHIKDRLEEMRLLGTACSSTGRSRRDAGR
jgi:RNA polymerase sigma factor (sigma-70 family)